MGKKTGTARVLGKLAQTTAEGRELAAKYHGKMPEIDGKPGGYASIDDFVWTYLVPYALNRLAALDRYAAKQPAKEKKPRAKKTAKKAA